LSGNRTVIFSTPGLGQYCKFINSFLDMPKVRIKKFRLPSDDYDRLVRMIEIHGRPVQDTLYSTVRIGIHLADPEEPELLFEHIRTIQYQILTVICIHGEYQICKTRK